VCGVPLDLYVKDVIICCLLLQCTVSGYVSVQADIYRMLATLYWIIGKFCKTFFAAAGVRVRGCPTLPDLPPEDGMGEGEEERREEGGAPPPEEGQRGRSDRPGEG
jgi:hypothetical protein